MITLLPSKEVEFPVDDELLQRDQILPFTEDRAEHFVGGFPAERVEPELSVEGLAVP